MSTKFWSGDGSEIADVGVWADSPDGNLLGLPGKAAVALQREEHELFFLMGNSPPGKGAPAQSGTHPPI
jgi:hypothetical protein